MRKGILFSLLCLIAIVSVACGGGNNAAGNKANGASNGADGAAADGGTDGGTTEVDAYALYKKKGRSWMTKNDMDAGGTKMVSYSKTEVVEVTDDHAMIKVWTLGEDKKPMAGMPEPTPTEIKFVKAEPVADAKAPATEVKKETVKVAAGEFECYFTENSGTKSWSSVKYPGLPVKMESATMKMELVEFNE
jgi:hypothetical protein